MTLKDFYKYSWFSNMAYVQWSSTNTSDKPTIIATASDPDVARIPTTLGDYIFNQRGWSISTKSIYENGSSGFAANVFSKEGTNEKVLAIRGTEAGLGYPVQTVLDLGLADLGEIGFLGLAMNQAVSMFNYIQQLRAAKDDTHVLRLGLNVITLPGILPSPVPAGTQSISIDLLGSTTYVWFDVHHDAQGLGELAESDQVTVTGHSLGGHLAALAARLFPDLFDQSVIFNAAGFDPFTSLKATDEVIGLFGGVLAAEGQAQPAFSFADVPIFNLEAEDSAPGDDTNLVASLVTGIPAGIVQDIRVENNSHSMDQMMDSLGVLSLLEQLNPLMPTDQIFALYDSMSNQSGATEETLLEQLSRLFLFNDTELDVVEAGLISHGDFDRRSANHERLMQIQEAIKDQGYLLESIADQSLGQLIENAKNSLAWSYALKELNPFVITGKDALYAAHNQNHALELYDKVNNPEGQITEQYLEDRAKLLELVINSNLLDIPEGENVTGTFGKYYEDVDKDIKILPAEYDPLLTERVIFGSNKTDTPDTLTGGNRDDHLFGQNGDDILDGGAGLDYLEGGEGNDTLIGISASREDQDILNGGNGFDTYLPGLGDVIEDSDGQGVIMEHGMVIDISSINLTAAGSDVYTNNDPDNPLRFKLLPDGTLQVIGSYFTIKNFTNGDLGITLDPNAPQSLNYIAATEYSDRLGTPDVNGWNGSIAGTKDADEMHGLAGDDEMDGKDGDDVMFGEDGDDVLIGNYGNDVLEGGEGRDALLSGIDMDVLIGGPGDDFLSGFDEEDYLEGGEGNDFLAGGTETDTLLGGTGDDVLLGDGMYFVSDRTWQVTVTDTTPGVPGGETISFDGPVSGVEQTETARDVADYLDGGAGNDILLGGGGNDQLYGRNDADTLEGGADDDYLDGGAGDDVLWGDRSNDPDQTGDDTLIGGEGNDYLVGGRGDDKLSGGPGDDVIQGDDTETPALGGKDEIDGGDGNDQVLGGAGDDVISGGKGLDTLQGGDGNDVIEGGEDDDYIVGEAGNDVLLGGKADDQLFGDEGDDTLKGGEGNDTLQGNVGDDRLYGDGGKDILVGGDGNDLLFGGEDNDTLAGNAGDDELHGDAGDDSMQGNEGNDRIFGEDGDDLLFGQAGDDQLSGGLGNDQLIGDAGNDNLDGGDGDDVLFGQADNDTLNGGSGLDILQGGDGDDILSGGADVDSLYGEAGNDVLAGGDGDDQLVGDVGDDSLSGGGGADQIFGDAGSDNLSGGDGKDLLVGGDGSDQLAGNAGDDELEGGTGDDVYRFNLGDGHDVIFESTDTQGDYLVFGPGILLSDLSFSKQNGRLVIQHVNGTDSITIENWYADNDYRLDRFVFADGIVLTADEAGLKGYTHLVGTGGNDRLIGDSQGQLLEGFAGNDFLAGNAGNDTLAGGTGNDTMLGGGGADLFLLGLGDGVDSIQETGLIDDTVRFGAGVLREDVSIMRVGRDLVFTHANGADKLTILNWYDPATIFNAISQVQFTEGDITLTFSQLTRLGMEIDQDYYFNPGDGAVTIEDFGGEDMLTFGAGIQPGDLVISRVNNDLVFAHSNGTDRLFLAGWFDGPTLWTVARSMFIETIRFTDSPVVYTPDDLTQRFLTINGTAGNDLLKGGNLDETFLGLAGSDEIHAEGGKDQITGGTGNDLLFGGNGADRYYFARGDGNDTIDDTSDSSSTNTIVFASNLTVNNFLVSDQGVNTVLLGFTDSPDTVTLKNVSTSTLNGKFIFKFTLEGTAQADIINGSNLGAPRYGDIIYGYAGNDQLIGLGGYDELYGGDGNDFLDGGAGIDFYFGDSGDDILGGGTGTDDFVGGFNEYHGGGGNDTLRGTVGDDTYYFNAGDGHDTIIEDLGFLNSFSPDDSLIFGPGITIADITANFSGSNLVIHVGTSDTITVNRWLESGRYHVDHFKFADGARLTNGDMTRMALTQVGTAGNDTLNGIDGYTDTLVGMGGDDILNGMSGDDVLDGGAGNDILNGGIGNDEYIFNRSYGTDVIFDPDGIDTVTFAAGITAVDIEIGRMVNSLKLTIRDTGDSLIISDYLLNPAQRIEQFVFQDNSRLPDAQTLIDSLINITGTNGDDVLNGSDGFETIRGLDGNDVINGFGWGDILSGGAGNDTLYGGSGDDTLQGEAGNDVYVINTGDGLDHITDNGGENVATFGSGINADGLSLQITWSGSSHVADVGYNPTSALDRLQIDDGLNTGIQSFAFATGTPLSRDGLLQLIAARDGSIQHHAAGTGSVTINGTNYNDTINASLSDDRLYGWAGNDVINGDAGNDYINGGTGDDALSGGTGNDTYLFSRSHGHDVIFESTTAAGGDVLRFDNDIAFADVQVQLDRKNLVFTMKEGSDTVTLDNWKGRKSVYPITVEFGDGTVLTSTNLNASFKTGDNGNNTMRGSTSNDYLYGLGGNDRILAKDGMDIIDGGSGNDSLEGGAGNDTYQFTAGFGTDTLTENDTTPGNTDTVAFGSGLDPLDLQFERMTNDLRVSVVGTGDSVTVQDWYLGPQYQTEIFKSSDGSILLNTSIEQLIQAMAGFSAETGLDWTSAVQQRPEDVQVVLATSWQAAA
jgi:Ca2+-binding RTX toxin-like protein